MVPVKLHFTVGNVSQLPGGRLLAADRQEAHHRALGGGIARVIEPYAVHVERVFVDIGFQRSEGGGPYAVASARHRESADQAFAGDFGCFRGIEPDGYRAIRGDLRGFDLRPRRRGGCHRRSRRPSGRDGLRN